MGGSSGATSAPIRTNGATMLPTRAMLPPSPIPVCLQGGEGEGGERGPFPQRAPPRWEEEGERGEGGARGRGRVVCALPAGRSPRWRESEL